MVAGIQNTYLKIRSDTLGEKVNSAVKQERKWHKESHHKDDAVLYGHKLSFVAPQFILAAAQYSCVIL